MYNYNGDMEGESRMVYESITNSNFLQLYIQQEREHPLD